MDIYLRSRFYISLRRIGKRYYIDIRIRGTKKRIRPALHTAVKPEALDLNRAEKDRIQAEYNQKSVQSDDFSKNCLDWARFTKPASAG